MLRKIQTQEAIVAEVKASVSEHIKQKELYEREYKLAKNLLDSSKIEYNNNVISLKKFHPLDSSLETRAG